MKISKVHILFILSGIILTVACILLSHTDCIKYTYFNAWALEKATTEYIRFFPNSFLRYGIIEIALLPCRKRILRGIAILVSLLNVIGPWLFIVTNNALSASIYDIKFYYTIDNPIPYLITVLATLLLIQAIVMFFLLCPKKKNSTA